MHSKLALGTVQFGLDYGISNKRGKVPEEEVKKILDLALKQGIKVLDTSGGYGSSEEVIGKYQKETQRFFQVVSKFVPRQSGARMDIRVEVMSSLRRLNGSSLYGFLFHRFEDFQKNERLWEDFQLLKKEGLVQKIGFSLYHVENLEMLFEKGIRFDMIQLPYSIFDRRFEKYFSRLKEMGCEIHVRSVFLQGLVFLDPESLSSFFAPIKDRLALLHDLASQNGKSVGAICLDDALSNSLVDRVVVGIDRIEALEENIKSCQQDKGTRSITPQLRSLEITDENILLPYRWPKEGVRL